MNDNDNGYTSRKFFFSVLTSVLIVMCGIFSAFWTGFASGLSAVISGLLGSLALYSGANVTSKIFADKAENKAQCDACEAEAETEVKEEAKK